MVLRPGGPLQVDYAVWDPNGKRTGVPLDRMWVAFGPTNKPQRNVNTEEVLNSYKERIWSGKAPMSDELRHENGYDDYTRPDIRFFIPPFLKKIDFWSRGLTIEGRSHPVSVGPLAPEE